MIVPGFVCILHMVVIVRHLDARGATLGVENSLMAKFAFSVGVGN